MPESKGSQQIIHSSSTVSIPGRDPSACWELSGKFARGPMNALTLPISMFNCAMSLTYSPRSTSKSFLSVSKRLLSSSKRVLSPLRSSSEACADTYVVSRATERGGSRILRWWKWTDRSFSTREWCVWKVLSRGVNGEQQNQEQPAAAM